MHNSEIKLNEPDQVFADIQEQKSNRSLRATLILLSVILIWGVNFPVMKYAFKQIHPMVFNEIRFSISPIILIIILLVTEGWQKISKQDWLHLAVLGFFQTLLYQLLFVNGLITTASGVASILTSTSPLWTALFAWVFKVEKLSKWLVLGIAIAFVGIIMIVLGGTHGSFFGDSFTGEVIVLISAMIWASGTLISKRLLEKYSALRITAISMALNAVPLLCIGFPFALHQNWQEVRFMTWLAVLFSSLFAVLIGYLAWAYAVQHLGATRTASFGNLTPVIAFISAYIIAHERVASLQIAGAVVIFAAIWLSRKNNTG